MANKFKLKGHGSFHIREGWLRKGLKNVENNPYIFAEKDVVDILGVGSNMVSAIRFWLQATGLTEERIGEKGKRRQDLTDFGKKVSEKDPYFEDIFTIWLIHYALIKNKEINTTFNLFFNKLNIDEFDKNEMYDLMKYGLDDYTNHEDFSQKSLADDCSCIIKSYLNDEKESLNPEDRLKCPLTELELIGKCKIRGKDFYYKNKPRKDKLDKLVVLYIIVDNMHGENGISIDAIINSECNAGKVLNLDRTLLSDYLDKLKNEGLIELNRTAGLDYVYIAEKYKDMMNASFVLDEYYSR